MGLRSFLVLHRRMGLISALFVLILASTGLVLHYSNTLGLDSRYINSPALLGWYGIESPEPRAAFRVETTTVIQIERTLYLNEEVLPGSYSLLTGMASAAFGLVVTTENEILLLTSEGQLIEVLGPQHGVPVPVAGIANNAGAVWLRSGAAIYRANFETLEFAIAEGVTPDWIAPERPSDDLVEAVTRQYATSLLSWERVMLDLHSGQLLGAAGRVLVDIMALLFILMAVTGIWIWSKRRP